MTGDRLIDIRSACERLGKISRPTFHRLAASGDLRTCKVGRRTMVAEADIHAFIEGRREAARSAHG